MSDDEYQDSAYVSFARAGFDKEFTLFKLYTEPLGKDGETGVYETACRFPLENFETAADPVGLLKSLMRRYLKNAIMTTKVPAELWVIELSPIMERYNLPSHLFIRSATDRSWLF